MDNQDSNKKNSISMDDIIAKIKKHARETYEKDMYGRVDLDGKSLRLLSQPAIEDETGKHMYYTCTAMDEDGNEYQVCWDIIDESEPEGTEACDWDKYYFI